MAELFENAPVALILLGVIILASIITFQNQQLHRQWMLHPYSIVNDNRWYTVFTSSFIHADWGHLLMNSLAYYFFAFTLEQFVGHFAFILIFIAGLLFSDITTIMKHKDHPHYYSLGASGVVSTLVFASIMFWPMGRIGVFFLPPMPSWLFGILYLGFTIYASQRGRDNINHEAHLWGALTGIFITIILYVFNIIPIEPEAITIVKEFIGM